MKKVNLFIALTITLVFFIGTILVVIINNDHAECEIIRENYTGPMGEKISTEEHICKAITFIRIHNKTPVYGPCIF